MIKLYAWELPFQRLIAGTRLQELHELKKVVLLQAVSMFSWTGSPLLVSELKQLNENGEDITQWKS